jgi:hypothetical protein
MSIRSTNCKGTHIEASPCIDCSIVYDSAKFEKFLRRAMDTSELIPYKFSSHNQLLAVIRKQALDIIALKQKVGFPC